MLFGFVLFQIGVRLTFRNSAFCSIPGTVDLEKPFNVCFSCLMYNIEMQFNYLLIFEILQKV